MTSDNTGTSIAVDTLLIAAFDAAVLFDERLTWKAKGLAAILLATGTWAGAEQVTTDDLIKMGADGRDSVQAGLRELEGAGYLTRTQRTGEGGRIYWERTMHARPVTAPQPEKPVMVTGYLASDDGFSGDGKPGYGGQKYPRTSDGKPGYGAAPATTGDEAQNAAETSGKAGYGADALPIHAYEHTRARAEEEELYISRTNDLDQDNTPPRSSTPRSKGGSRVNPAGARGRASDPSSLGTVASDPALGELAASILAQCGVRANLTLYPEFAFEKIRAECVRWMTEYPGPSSEHARAKNAGALVYRIRRNPYLALTEAERASHHYLAWRTEAEREADRAALVDGVAGAGVTGYLASDEAEQAEQAAEARERFKVVNIPGSKAQVHFDTLAPTAAPEWGEVMYALALAGYEMEFRGTAAAPTADGSWIVYAPDERQAEHLRVRLAKQLQWKLVPVTGRARSDIALTFTADRAAYEAAAIVSGTVQAH